MHLETPATWSGLQLHQLAERCKQYDASCSIYGAIPTDFPTGRPNDVASINQKDVGQHFRLASQLGIETNYLLNGVDAVLLLKNGQKEIEEYINWVTNTLKPDLITVSDPELALILSRRFEWNNFVISTIAGVQTEDDLDDWLEMAEAFHSAYEVILHHDATRGDWNRLENFTTYAKMHGIRSSLLLTESCYFGCKSRQSHYAVVGKPYNIPDGFDYYQSSCILKRLLDPSTLLDLVGFLMPEELKEITAKTGISTFKITGRSCSTDWISNTINYYLQGRSPENLYEIIVFTAPLLERHFNMRVADLFYLDSSEYLSIIKNLKHLQPGTTKWRDYLNTKAIEMFRDGKLMINDPSSQYDIKNGHIIQTRAGNYGRLLRKTIQTHNSLAADTSQQN